MQLSLSRRSLLLQDGAGIQAFLNEFDPPENGEGRGVALGRTSEFVFVRNFPLPNGYHPDYVDIMLAVHQYPSRPPGGLYVLRNGNDAVLGHLHSRFNLLDNGMHGAPTIEGYKWICYHYDGDHWKFNQHDVLKGDCLRKFLINWFNMCR